MASSGCFGAVAVTFGAVAVGRCSERGHFWSCGGYLWRLSQGGVGFWVLREGTFGAVAVTLGLIREFSKDEFLLPACSIYIIDLISQMLWKVIECSQMILL